MRLGPLSLAFLISLSTAGTVFAERYSVYDCSFKVSAGAFLGEKLTLFVSEESDKSFAIDGVIHYTYGEPIPVQSSSTDAKIVSRWRLDTHDSNGQAISLNYRLAYIKKSGRANITATAVRFANKDTAHGSCERSVRNLTG